MEIRYQRDLNKSYMVIQKEQVDWEDFEMRMIQQNKIEGLLEMFEVVQDQKLSFLYDISGMQSLDVYLQRKEVTKEFLQNLVYRLKQVSSRLQDYLLSQEALVLSLESVFIKNDEMKFVYLPGNEQGVAAGLQRLMENMLGQIDHSDRSCVELAYRLYQRTTEENFSFNSFLEELKEEVILKPAPKRSIKTTLDEAFAPPAPDPIKEQPVRKHKIEKKKLGIPKTLSKWLLKDQQDEPEDIFDDEPLSSEFAFVSDRVMSVSEDKGMHPTVYLDSAQQEVGQFRYEGFGTEENFFAKKEKNFIGKQEDADIVLHSDSVSRLHAVVTHENSGFYLEDLNSTNGTFVNEKAVQYKEKVMLKRGDEIRFGDAKYAFY
ncbi:MAG: FHA domain-containing protein [Eubacterium sp.]|nr:FHA domain-containing protein [Eubacterium sp.]